MQTNYIEKVTPSNIMKLTDKPEHILGYEVQVSSDLSQLSWIPTFSGDLYIEGFRISGIFSDEFDILHMVENFDHIFYLSQIANALCIENHKYVYIAMSCSYSREFYITNNKIFQKLVGNLIFLQRCFTYVQFVIENVPISHVHKNEFVVAQNFGSPVSGVVSLLHNAGCFNVFSSINYREANDAILRGCLLHDAKRSLKDYVDDSCRLINISNLRDDYEYDAVRSIRVLCPHIPIAMFDTGSVEEL